MAYAITGGTNSSYMLTYQSTRPLTLLYFDGESAALMGLGQLDTQMLHLYGNVSGPPRDGTPNWHDFLEPEYRRATGLCAWLEDRGLRGGDLGVEGVVRMNAGFEVIWCDFASESLRLVSKRNVTATRLRDDNASEDVQRHGLAPMGRHQDTSPFPLPDVPTSTTAHAQPTESSPPNQWQDLDLEPFAVGMFWGWLLSATWHYGSSRAAPALGEGRARVQTCGILSYYSPEFVDHNDKRAEDERRRLNLTDVGVWTGGGNVTTGLEELARRRRMHHLEGVTEVEAARMRVWTESMLRGFVSGKETCSGMDWTVVMAEIVQRTTGHLKHMQTKLFSPPDDDALTAWKWIYSLRDLSHMFLMPFLEYPYKADKNHWQPSSALYDATYSRCRYHYTRLLVDLRLSPEERDLRWAVEETFGTICSVLLTVGFGIEHMWFSHFDLDPKGPDTPSIPPGLNSTVSQWADNVAELLAWLGWEGEVVTCEKVCAWDERCYIPMWPLQMFGPHGDGPGRGNRTQRPPHYYPPSYGYPPYGGGRPPGFNWTMPRRAPWMMGDDALLFEPVCVKREDMRGSIWS